MGRSGVKTVTIGPGNRLFDELWKLTTAFMIDGTVYRIVKVPKDLSAVSGLPPEKTRQVFRECGLLFVINRSSRWYFMFRDRAESVRFLCLSNRGAIYEKALAQIDSITKTKLAR